MEIAVFFMSDTAMGRVTEFPRSTGDTYIGLPSGAFCGRDATRSGLTSMEQLTFCFTK